ncbi:MAG: division/cell wall cluster transcriptional repressor MraZ [Lachnospiraceae bacterium]|nr:division/cell wall cluster transcriptional repressor MraZ [Lachnospiraceae bacterium]MBQ9606205.1 division/cell wall cluster transcriptional repressor MraZ [Lachnospiraceae bacterium]
MFIGEYNHTIDAKGRLIVPAKYRDNLGEHFYVMKGYDDCLFVYGEEDFKALGDQIRALPLSNKASRAMSRFFLGSAQESEFDKQGRILVSAPLREHAGLEKDVVLVGVGNHIEIWSKDRYDAAEDSIDVDEVASKLEEMGLSL